MQKCNYTAVKANLQEQQPVAKWEHKPVCRNYRIL
jgi:hypothetical protein